MEYKQLTKHTGSSAIFLTNFMLLREAGYFDNAADTKPMLHLWSLAVEEQFYLVWPLLMMALLAVRAGGAELKKVVLSALVLVWLLLVTSSLFFWFWLLAIADESF